MNTEFFIQQEIRSFNNKCLAQSSKIKNETTVSGVVRCIQAHPSPMISSLVRSQVNDLKRKAELRAEELIKKTIGEIHKCTSNEEKATLISAARRDWATLRGNFPRLSASCDRFLMKEISMIRKDSLGVQTSDNDSSHGM